MSPADFTSLIMVNAWMLSKPEAFPQALKPRIARAVSGEAFSGNVCLCSFPGASWPRLPVPILQTLSSRTGGPCFKPYFSWQPQPPSTGLISHTVGSHSSVLCHERQNLPVGGVTPPCKLGGGVTKADPSGWICPPSSSLGVTRVTDTLTPSRITCTDWHQ